MAWAQTATFHRFSW